jgi:hypothetical protein
VELAPGVCACADNTVESRNAEQVAAKRRTGHLQIADLLKTLEA